MSKPKSKTGRKRRKQVPSRALPLIEAVNEANSLASQDLAMQMFYTQKAIASGSLQRAPYAPQKSALMTSVTHVTVEGADDTFLPDASYVSVQVNPTLSHHISVGTTFDVFGKAGAVVAHDASILPAVSSVAHNYRMVSCELEVLNLTQTDTVAGAVLLTNHNPCYGPSASAIETLNQSEFQDEPNVEGAAIKGDKYRMTYDPARIQNSDSSSADKGDWAWCGITDTLVDVDQATCVVFHYKGPVVANNPTTWEIIVHAVWEMVPITDVGVFPMGSAVAVQSTYQDYRMAELIQLPFYSVARSIRKDDGRLKIATDLFREFKKGAFTDGLKSTFGKKKTLRERAQGLLKSLSGLGNLTTIASRFFTTRTKALRAIMSLDQETIDMVANILAIERLSRSDIRKEYGRLHRPCLRRDEQKSDEYSHV